MPVSTFTAYPDNGSLASFNDFGSKVSSALQAAGLVKTNDTGQIDWATNTAYPNNVAGVSIGYEIYRFSDTLQDSAPVFLKIEYGSFGNSSISTGFGITIGSGSDGAGNITGIIYSRTTVGTGTAASTRYNSFVSVGAGRIIIGMNINSSNNTFYGVAIERHHDDTGIDIDTGVNVVSVANAGKYSQCCFFSRTSPNRLSGWGCIVPPSGSGALSPDINVYPVRCWTPGEGYPLHSVMAYVSTDFTPGATYSITNYDGISRTYIAVALIAVAYGGTGYAMLRYD